MNIIWTVNTEFETKDHREKAKTLTVNTSDVWQDIFLSKPNRRMRGNETVDITHKGEVFRDIPTHWYMIEN
jgi:hypothetical protein